MESWLFPTYMLQLLFFTFNAFYDVVYILYFFCFLLCSPLLFVININLHHLVLRYRLRHPIFSSSYKPYLISSNILEFKLPVFSLHCADHIRDNKIEFLPYFNSVLVPSANVPLNSLAVHIWNVRSAFCNAWFSHNEIRLIILMFSA